MPTADTPLDRAMRRSQMMTDFVCAPFPPQPESPAPAWLTTVEGQRYLEALRRGDVEGALQVFDDAGWQITCTIIHHMFDDLTTTTQEAQP